MPTVEIIDNARRLEEMAKQLFAAAAPTPLGAYDGHDLRCAADEIRKLREENTKLKEERKHLFCRDEL